MDFIIIIQYVTFYGITQPLMKFLFLQYCSHCCVMVFLTPGRQLLTEKSSEKGIAEGKCICL